MSTNTSWIKRLRQNKLAMFCLTMLLLLSMLACGAYLIILDNTTDANRQIPTVALSKPGYHQPFIVKKRPNRSAVHKTLLEKLIRGSNDDRAYVPYDSFEEDGIDIITTYNNVLTVHDSLKIKAYQSKNLTFWFGTDKYGRDVLSRIILGLRISLCIGFCAVLVSLAIGITIGSISGYYGGRTDQILMLLINTSWSIPTLLMAFAIIIALGKGFLVIVLAVGLTMWVDVARIVRGEVLQIRNELYVSASRVLGYNDFRTITRHVLPNIIGSILVMAAANFATAILVEAGLSYLGLGIQPPTPSLGNMLQESYAYATGGFVYLAFIPILTIMILVLSFNLLGTALRDVFDIRQKDHE